jgi:CTP:molybdopterin cytidylyltransferase MocA
VVDAEPAAAEPAVTVVVPCAGHGSRLGLPFPKELLPAEYGKVALDGVFDLLAPHRERVRVVLVIDAGRQATVAHVSARYPDWAVAFVCQQPAQPGMVGAVRSARAWFTGRVLVLLPDQWLTAAAHDPVGRAVTALDTHPACLLAAAEKDPERIAVDGAVRVRRDGTNIGRAVALADKPGIAGTGMFDAVWFGLGFTQAAADAVLDQVAASEVGTLADAELRRGPLGGAPVIDVPPFTDLGTWPAVVGHWARLAGVR